MSSDFFVLQTYTPLDIAAEALADQLLAYGHEHLSARPGFISGSAFLEPQRPTEDGPRDQLLVIMHWRDRPTYESYRSSDLGLASVARLISYHPKLDYYKGFEAIGDMGSQAGHHMFIRAPAGEFSAAELAGKFREFVLERMALAKGFLGALILLHEKESEVATLFRWSDVDSYRAYRQSEAGQEGAQRLKKYALSVWRVTLRGIEFGKAT